MSTIKTLKKQAKTSLDGKWAIAVAGLLSVFSVVLFVYLFYSMLCWVTCTFVATEDKIDMIFTVKLLVVFSLTFLLSIALLPITNGFFKLCYNIACGRDANFGDVFYFFKGTKKYFKALQFNIFACATLYAAYFVTFSGYNMLKIAINKTVFEDLPLFIIARSVLFSCGVALFILFSIRIIFSEFVFVDDENARLSYISYMTAVIFKRHRLDIILLNYSFIPWIALCFLVIPALYVIPYMSTTLATSAKWLMKLYKEGKIV